MIGLAVGRKLKMGAFWRSYSVSTANLIRNPDISLDQ